MKRRGHAVLAVSCCSPGRACSAVAAMISAFGEHLHRFMVAAIAVDDALCHSRGRPFPEQLLASDWLADSARSLAIRPNAADVPVWTVVLASAVAWWRGATREQPAIDAALMLLKAGAIVALVACRPCGNGFGVSDRDASAAVLVFAGASTDSDRDDAAGPLPGARARRWLETVIVPVLVITVPAAMVVGCCPGI